MKRVAMLILCAALLAGCGAAKDAGDPLAGSPKSDMSGYSGLADYKGALRFVDADMEEIKSRIEDKQTFVVFFSFANCPYCNRVIPYVNDAADEAGRSIAYVDTRKDPSWKSNLDLAGYEIVEEYFGEYLDIDDDGKAHLYVPDLYFIKDGAVVGHHSGVVTGADDPAVPLTEEQEANLRELLKEEFAKL